MQQRKPVKKCVLKNLITGNNLEYNFKSGETVEEADLRKAPATYMYQTEDIVSFMLADTFETLDLSKELLSGKEGYLKDGLEVIIQYFNEEPIGVELPIKISFEVTQTEEVVDRGNTSSNVLKDAIIETGLEVKVPSFIKPGEKVIINTVEDQYVSRDTGK
jgi:elongation factor P